MLAKEIMTSDVIAVSYTHLTSIAHVISLISLSMKIAKQARKFPYFSPQRFFDTHL